MNDFWMQLLLWHWTEVHMAHLRLVKFYMKYGSSSITSSRQFHKYCIITWNLVSHPNDAHLTFHSYSFMKELGFLCAHATKDWCFLCSVLSETLRVNLSRATTTHFYENTSYWNGWKSSTTITVPCKFHYHHSVVLYVTYSLYVTSVTNFAAESSVSKFSINSSFSFFQFKLPQGGPTHITVKYTVKIEG